MKKTVKILLSLVVAVALVLLGGVLLLHLLFPPERIREIAEANLGRALGDRVEIGDLSLSLTRGFEARDISIGGEKGPVRIKRLSFFYDLSELLHGEFVITELNINRPVLFLERGDEGWNFERYSGKPPEDGQSRTEGKGAIPSLPFAVQLQSFTMDDLSLRVKMEGLDFQWDGLDLEARATVSGKRIGLDAEVAQDKKTTLPSLIKANFGPSGTFPPSFSVIPGIHLHLSARDAAHLKLAGKVMLRDLFFKREENPISPVADMDLALDLNLPAGAATLDGLELRLLGANRMRLRGEATHLFTRPVFSASFDGASLNLKSLDSLLRLAYPSLHVSGSVASDGLLIKGRVKDSGAFEVSTAGEIALREISAEKAGQAMEIKGASGELRMKDLSLDASGPFRGDLSMIFSMERARYRRNTIQGLSLTLKPVFTASREGRLDALTSLLRVKRLRLTLPDTSTVTASPSLRLRIDGGDKHDGRLYLHCELNLGNLHRRYEKTDRAFPLSLGAELTLEPGENRAEIRSLRLNLPGNSALNFRGGLDLKKSLHLNLEGEGRVLLDTLLLSGFLPKLSLGGLAVLERAGLDFQADPDFRHITAGGDGTLELKGVRAALAEDKIRGLGGAFRWRLDGINEKGIGKASGFLDAQYNFAAGAARGVDLGPGKGRLRISTEGSGKARLDLEVQNTRMSLPLSKKESLSFPFRVQGTVTGNPAKGDFNIESLRWDTGDTLRGEARGKIERFGTKGLKIRHELHADLAKVMGKARHLSPLPEAVAASGRLLNVTTIRGRIRAGKPEAVVFRSRSDLSHGAFSFQPLSLDKCAMQAGLRGNYEQGQAAVQGTMHFNSSGLASGRWRGPPLDLSLSFQTASDLVRGNHRVKGFQIALKNLGSFHMEGAYSGKSFRIRAAVNKLELGRLMENIPAGLLESLPKIKARGGLNILLNAKGKLPTPREMKDFPATPLPLSVSGRIRVRDAGVHLPGVGLHMSGMNGPLRVRYGKGGIRLSSVLSVTDLSFPKVFSGSTALKSEADIHWDPQRNLKINKLNFSLPGYGLRQSLRGAMNGLTPFMAGDGKWNAQNILNRVSFKLEDALALHLPRPLAFFSGGEARGDANLEMTVALRPRRELSLGGKLSFHAFHLKYGDLGVVENLHGGLPFRRKLFIQPGKAAQTVRRPKPRPSPLALLVPVAGREKLFMDSLTMMGRRISQVELEPSFTANLVSLDRIAFKILGGYTVGKLSLEKGERADTLQLRLDFAGIDSRKLSGEESGKKSSVNGNLIMRLPLPGRDLSREFDIGAMNMEMNLTRIGEGALDRLLLFLDPRESNPGIVNLRSKLKLAVPLKFAIKLKRGALSLSTQLKLLAAGGGTLKISPLERVPISRISGFRKLNKFLEGAKKITPLLDLLFAEQIEIRKSDTSPAGTRLLIR